MSLEAFNQIPFVGLLQHSTPLNPLSEISERFATQVLIKRDDLTGVGIGGNKIRKLEYLLAEVKAAGCSTVVTAGGLQSNHAVSTAMCAKKLGLNCHLALVDAVPIADEVYQQHANLTFDRLAGANIHRFPAGTNPNQAVTELVEQLKGESGISAYPICMGGSSEVGALGYVKAAIELAEQFKAQNIQPNSIVHASGSAGTQAGLIVGFKLLNMDIKVLGCSVLHPKQTLVDMIEQLCSEMGNRLAIDCDWRSLIHVTDQFLGEGYGLPSELTLKAIEQGLNDEALLLDPCYTGKAFSYLLHLLETKDSELGAQTVFLHTGGVSGSLAYSDYFMK